MRADAVCETFVVLRQDNESFARGLALLAVRFRLVVVHFGVGLAHVLTRCEAFRAREIVGDDPGFA